MFRVEILLHDAKEGLLYWINPETLPAWASFCVAIAAVCVALKANFHSNKALLASLRQEIMRTNSETVRMADDLRNRMISVRKSNEEFIAKEKILPEVANTFREILDLENLIRDLNPFNDKDLKLIEAAPNASREILEDELHNALLLRLQFSATPARFDASIAELNKFILHIASNPAAKIQEPK